MDIQILNSQILLSCCSIIAAALAVGLGALGVSVGEGRVVEQFLSSLTQQPDKSSEITKSFLLGIAIIEASEIYCIVFAMIFIYVNPYFDVFTKFVK